MGKLGGKAVLVTGGAQRIGRAIALACAREGADVAITFLNSERQARKTASDIEKLGRRALAVRCDIRQEKSVSAAAKEVLRELKRLDVLVNNAGFYETAAFDKITPQQWTQMFAVNTQGPYLMAQACRKVLERSQGRIVNLGSLGGLRPWVTHAHYCASRAALIMLTQIMAKAFAPAIAVNCVAPGMIATGAQSQKMLARFAAKTPMRRAGSPEDVAAAVLWFATAPQFVTGQVLAVDGGLGLLT
jgi:NAD(P)-dependent dehydrogenase (short-subunit alcohol dehydrogenase family)